MTIITPHYNGTACYNREFSFNMVRQHLWFSNPWKESPPVQSLLGMDTFYTMVSPIPSVPGQFNMALTPSTNQACLMYTSRITWIRCTAILRSWCPLLSSWIAYTCCVCDPANYCSIVFSEVPSLLWMRIWRWYLFERHHQAGARHASRM